MHLMKKSCKKQVGKLLLGPFVNRQMVQTALNFITFRIYLEFVYFAETEIFFVESTIDKGKILVEIVQWDP